MSKIIEENGEEIEVFTAEELEQQKQEAIEEYKMENPDKSDELTALQEEIARKEEELDKMKGKDLNFSNLRKQKEEAEKKVADILAGVDDKINKAKSEVFEGVMKDHYNETIRALSGEDEEVLKKIEYHYKRLSDSATTKQEITNKLRDAYILATKPEGYDALNSTVISTGGVGKLNIKNQSLNMTPEEKEVASKFGLTDKDLQKYGNK